jgi:agmatine/peptidylarginine deiminase
MNPLVWQEYVSGLKGEARQVLSYYPFKWALAHPSDSQGALEFLQDIGMGEGQVTSDSYEIIAVPCPVGKSRLLPIGWRSVHLYANSLMLNHRVLLCQYGHSFEKYDEEAIKVYRKALPDYEIISIDCSVLANGGGGINCTTREIPDITRLADTPQSD